ncbi:efflux RND transporter periplasmic adaptor subunit [Lewinella sp. W8]|uniref:efflux RND transporter periplasmic adaptor subunit n=1 Tax=Lewinella sp. W8 TaxID=2528208 RepID=UPI001067264B|nr:HlyD family efflux transporter periplasmic adaptor subunit [Lewinella sp. W8]MTB52486.1 HlyD family efflux transporter periplasmic adaptor subunit [Lewinella sp. W8]
MSNKNLQRILVALIGIVILAGGYFGMKYLQGMKQDTPQKEIPKRIKTVETQAVVNANIATELEVQGRLEAYNKIALFSEVGGTVEATGRPFKKGVYFKKGEVLLRMDDDEARLNLQAQKASLLNAIATLMPDLKIDYPESFPAWEEYLSGYSVDGALPALPTPVNQREKLFIAGRNLYSQYYSIKSLEERLSKYTLRAPISGVLTSTAIDEGAVVRAGQQLGELMATNYYELVATVPLSQLEYLKPGGKVELYSEDVNGSWTGSVKRISDQIDPGSQTVDVFIGVSGKGLREGMYLRGAADAKTIENVVEIDRDLLLNEQEVYVVENDTLLRLFPVTVEKFNRSTVIISGLPNNTQLLVSEVAGAFDGMRVNRKDSNTSQASTSASAQPVSK